MRGPQTCAPHHIQPDGLVITFPGAFTREEVQGIQAACQDGSSSLQMEEQRLMDMVVTASRMLWRADEIELIGGGNFRYNAWGDFRDMGTPWHRDTPSDDDMFANFFLASIQLTSSSAYEGGALEVGPVVASREQATGSCLHLFSCPPGVPSPPTISPYPMTPPAPQGTVVIFPAMLPHRVTNVTRGERRSLVKYYRGRRGEHSQQLSTRLLLALANGRWEKGTGHAYAPSAVLALASLTLGELGAMDDAAVMLSSAAAADPDRQCSLTQEIIGFHLPALRSANNQT